MSNDRILVCITYIQIHTWIFCLWGQTPHTFTGVSPTQTGFLVGSFVFTPTQKVASMTFKETNLTDALTTNCNDLLWHKHLV